jgi:hypothetical protein
MRESCGRCGAAKESSIHMTEAANAEIRTAAHLFESDDYVAWLRWNSNGCIVICDSDSEGAFKVYRRRDGRLIP